MTRTITPPPRRLAIVQRLGTIRPGNPAAYGAPLYLDGSWPAQLATARQLATAATPGTQSYAGLPMPPQYPGCLFTPEDAGTSAGGSTPGSAADTQSHFWIYLAIGITAAASAMSLLQTKGRR
jgi:hypothetical protein